MKSKICKHCGCFSVAVIGGDYCQKHIKDTEKKRKIFTMRARSQEWQKLYNSAKWHKLRQEFLNKYPVCIYCGRVANTVDHITPHRGNLDLFYNADNLQPLCKKCHSAKTLRENNYFRGIGGQK